MGNGDAMDEGLWSGYEKAVGGFFFCILFYHLSVYNSIVEVDGNCSIPVLFTNKNAKLIRK